MAYIPPHKRHSQNPPSMASPRRPNYFIRYAPNAISRWFVAGADGRPVPSYDLDVRPFYCEPMERNDGGRRPMTVVPEAHLSAQPDDPSEDPPWAFFAQRILPDLLETSRIAREAGQDAKLSFVVKLGKILFPWDSRTSMSCLKRAADGDETVRIWKNFYTTVPREWSEGLEKLLPRVGFDCTSEKETCTVLVLDKLRPDICLLCKCRPQSDGTLIPYKIEHRSLRYLVADTSCLFKGLDFRLMLTTKKSSKLKDVEEKDEIFELISSAVINPEVEGGLSWPGEKYSVADRFEAVGVWHLKVREFRGPLGKIKLRNADRFYYKETKGDVADEVTLKLTEVSNLLSNDNFDSDALLSVIQDALKLFWNNLLDIDNSSL